MSSYKIIDTIREVKVLTNKSVNTIMEMMRSVSETLVYGNPVTSSPPIPNHSIFLKKDLMKELEKYLLSNIGEVQIEILETIRILIQNVGNAQDIGNMLNNYRLYNET